MKIKKNTGSAGSWTKKKNKVVLPKQTLNFLVDKFFSIKNVMWAFYILIICRLYRVLRKGSSEA